MSPSPGQRPYQPSLRKQTWPPNGPSRRPRKWSWVVGAVVALLVLGGIFGGQKQAPTSGPTLTPGPTITAGAGAVPQASAPAAQSWIMPDLAGSGLQDAQDAIQALTGDGIFFTRSHDATGRGRHQILDRDWTVCTQNVRPGATISADTQIDFGAVKLSESC